MNQAEKPPDLPSSTSKARHCCCTMRGMLALRIDLDVGAKVIATSSWAVAERRVTGTAKPFLLTSSSRSLRESWPRSDAPVTVDFEGGYSDDDGALAENVSRLLELGMIGINFEDRVVQGAGLYAIDQHAASDRSHS